jgi:hypothetical protein
LHLVGYVLEYIKLSLYSVLCIYKRKLETGWLKSKTATNIKSPVNEPVKNTGLREQSGAVILQPGLLNSTPLAFAVLCGW